MEKCYVSEALSLDLYRNPKGQTRFYSTYLVYFQFTWLLYLEVGQVAPRSPDPASITPQNICEHVPMTVSRTWCDHLFSEISWDDRASAKEMGHMLAVYYQGKIRKGRFVSPLRIHLCTNHMSLNCLLLFILLRRSISISQYERWTQPLHVTCGRPERQSLCGTESLIDLSEIVTLATRSIIHLGFSLQIQHLVIEILFELQGSQHVRWIRNFSTDSNCHLPIIYLTLPFIQ